MLIEEITEENYLDKVEELDKVVEKKLLEFEAKLGREDNTGKRVDWENLYDPTVWAYHTLKDKQKKPLILRGYQDKIINDKHRFITVPAANQIGKTWAACVKAIHHAIHVDNASVLIVSKSEQQSVMILDEIKWMMKRSDIDFEPVIGEVENRTELHIINEDQKGISVIRCLPPTTSVLAFPATLIICDEIGFWEIEGMKQSEYFNRVIVSRTNETKNWTNEHFTMGQIFCISNPNAQQGVFWDLWNDADFHQYRYCWLTNKKNTIDEYMSWKNKIPSDQFDSVYAARFASASGGFITEEEYNDAIQEKYSVFPPPNQSICLGGDFAGEDTISRDVDETILFGGIKIRQDKIDKVKVIYQHQFPLRTKKEVVYGEIKRLINVSHFAYDKAGVGDSVKNDLIDQHILAEYQIESLTYSLPNKSEVFYNMKHLFEQRKILIPDLPKLKEQLMGLRFEKTEGGHIKVHHAREGLHDDWADALANCCWATLRSSGIPVEATFVEIEKTEEKKEKTLRFCEKCNDYHWGKCELTTI